MSDYTKENIAVVLVISSIIWLGCFLGIMISDSIDRREGHNKTCTPPHAPIFYAVGASLACWLITPIGEER